MVNVVTGQAARVQWGYLVAGTVRSWTATKAEDGSWSLVATVHEADTFRVTQRPLVFMAPHARGTWRWPVTSLQITDGTLTASLGPPEK
jgi:hypothetical protein